MSGEEWDLPADGDATVSGIRLPAGRRLAPAGGRGRQTPVLWATVELADAAPTWLALSDALRGAPMVPVLLSGLAGQTERPWDIGELSPCDPGEVDRLEAPVVLEEMWRFSVPDPAEDDAETAEVLDPLSRAFPGLAPAMELMIGTKERRQAASSLPSPLRLGLIAASRPADALAVVGWRGAANYHETLAPLAAVLRSWEDRFGARLVHLGFDTMDLLVERPVRSHADALILAAEHFAFCSDNIYQGAGSIREYAADLPDAAIWSFWWD